MVYKSQSSMNRPSLFPQQQQRMINSTSNIPNLTTCNSLKRSNSTSKKLPTIMDSSSSSSNGSSSSSVKSSNISRMDTIRRALTTSRSKKELTRSATGLFQPSNRREKKSFSLQNPPLFISLPDVEQLHTTPPLSPPSANQQIWTIPPFLPDLTQQQDNIIRHIAVLFIDSHVIEEESILLDDLIALLETNNKKSLWGKLKTHILTPTAENGPSNPLFNHTTNNEKKIGVSLSNTSHGSLNIYKLRDSPNIEHWKTHCPSVISCFSSHSLSPNFLKDCILSMIDQGKKNTLYLCIYLFIYIYIFSRCKH